MHATQVRAHTQRKLTRFVCIAENVTYVCENQTARIACPDGLFIQLLVANYGRFATHICNEGGRAFPNTMCSYEQTLEKLMGM